MLNRPVFEFRAPYFGHPPSVRVQDATARIQDILERGGPGAVGIRVSGHNRVLTIDGQLAFAVLPGDVPGGSGEAMDAIANNVRIALEQAIAETQEARDGRMMARGAIAAAIATAIYAALVWLLLRFGRWLTLRMLKVAGRASKRYRIGGDELMRGHRAMRITRAVLRVAGWVLLLLVTTEWLSFVLSRFPYTRAWSERLHSFLLRTATDLLVDTARALPELLIAIVIILIARSVDGMQRSFFRRVQENRIHVGWVDKDSAPATRRLVTLAVWAFAAVMAYPYIPGSSTDAFKGLSVLLGLMVSVGASGLVGQAASGLILMYTKSMRTGDYVRVGDAEGTVIAMGVFTTRVYTGKGEELMLPNATILGSATRNFSRSAQRPGIVLTVDVTIGYDVPWRQVEAMLLAAAQRTSAVRSQPPPRVLNTALHDFYVAYRLVCEAAATGPEERTQAASDLNAAVLDAFNEHGVQIMSPHYFADPAQPKVVPKSAWFAAPAKPPPPDA
ncbi:MAG: mechanosensitive ion channel family protein [Betaproteobacteria bacterium]|nr:mechanosensitive ion channel family protein [Betaproteobacteria bacterium]